ncbi:MAG: preprotein translocase subunit SecG, partial [Pseudobutyrivibrio sp.]|nr:preprotein translocase subunit SecG [Pseudobutyrivibrio sp.]
QQFDSYWSRNKGRSREGLLVKLTSVCVILFFVLSAVLNIGSF